jgi:glycosyltransferase involved in cell wall biosynthesis
VRLSIVLPTRNGGHLLEGCLRSVLGQAYEDMELVVSDNASTDETPETLRRFEDDPRFKAIRMHEPLEVTDNWINAVQASSGDYVLLIGDDDYLLPGYCERIAELIDAYDRPDCITYNAYAYAFPGALAGHRHSHFADPFFKWDPALPPEGPIPAADRRALVRDFFRFNFRIHLNLQTTIVSRRAIERMRNGFLKPPFPDFYALNALMLLADNWVYSPEQLIVIGISPKSFGHTVHGHDRTEGLRYLGISPDFPGHLPGNEVINGTYACLLELKRDYGPELAGIDIDRAQYVFNQVYAWYLQWRVGSLPPKTVRQRLRALGPRDWLLLIKGLAPNLSVTRLRRNVRIDRDDPVEHLWPGLRPLPEVDDIAAFARWVQSGREPVRP